MILGARGLDSTMLGILSYEVSDLTPEIFPAYPISEQIAENRLP